MCQPFLQEYIISIPISYFDSLLITFDPLDGVGLGQKTVFFKIVGEDDWIKVSADVLDIDVKAVEEYFGVVERFAEFVLLSKIATDLEEIFNATTEVLKAGVNVENNFCMLFFTVEGCIN